MDYFHFKGMVKAAISFRNKSEIRVSYGHKVSDFHVKNTQ